MTGCCSGNGQISCCDKLLLARNALPHPRKLLLRQGCTCETEAVFENGIGRGYVKKPATVPSHHCKLAFYLFPPPHQHLENYMNMSRLFLAGLAFFLLLTATTWAMEHTLGLGAGLVPDYEGSEDRRGVPMLMLKGNDGSERGFTLMGTNLKVDLVPGRDWSFGPALNYRQGRDDVDNDRVDALKDIDATLEAGAYGVYAINSWQFGAELLADVANEHNGMLAKFSVGYRWQAAGALTIISRASTTYADGDYMETYFGINGDNRGTSGLPDFEADAGLKDLGISLVFDYSPWRHWGIMGLLSYNALLNDAKDSPIVAAEGDDKQLVFGLMATYRWGSQ
jgi:MipA family protein